MIVKSSRTFVPALVVVVVAARESVPSIHRSHSSAGGGLGRAQQQQPDTRLEFGCPTLCSAATGSGGAGVQSTAGHGAGVHGRVAGWQYGGGADTRCWLHVEAARWPGVGRGRRGPGPASVQVLGVAGLCLQYEGYDVCQQQPSQTGP